MRNKSFARSKTLMFYLFITIASSYNLVQSQTPRIDYSTFLGGNSGDDGQEVRVDAEGHACITGYTGSSDFPLTPGCFYRTPTSHYFTKMNLDGSMLDYSTFLSPSTSVHVDKAGNTFFMNTVTSSDFPAIPNPDNCTLFIYKVDTAGNAHVYLNHWAYTGGFMTDNQGYVIIVGTTADINFPTTPNAYKKLHSGGNDVFIAKLDIENDSVLFATLLGGIGDEALSMAGSFTIDDENNIVIAGTTESSDFPIMGTPIAGYNSGSLFLTKLKANGSELIFSNLLGSGLGIWNIVVDNQSNTYLSGTINSETLITTPGAYDTTYNGNNDAYLIKLSADGSHLIYSTYIGGSGIESGRGIVADKDGKAYITGCTSSSDFPYSGNAIDTFYNGCSGAGCDDGWGNIYLLIMNPEGNQVEYSTFLGGLYEEAYGIAMDKYGDVYLTGGTNFSAYPTSKDAYKRNASGYEAYITKFSLEETSFNLSVSSNDLAVAAGANSKVSFGIVSNTSWSVSSPELWLSFDRKTGLNNDSVVVTAKTNRNPSPRAGVIKISGVGVDDQTITITQEADVTSIEEGENNRINVFPNPTSGQLIINFGLNSLQEINIEIYNLQGNQVLSKTSRNTSEAIDLSGLTKGVYFLKIIYDEKIYCNNLILK
jgi:hypothetical protein